MRLTDLEPKFAAPAGRHGCAITFLCPLCKGDLYYVPFANPLDGGAPPQTTLPDGSKSPRTLWTRTGETFETLTLTPSVNAEGCCVGSYDEATKRRTPCKGWHGTLTAGEIT